MIVIDTNVLSELMRPVPDPDVLGWAGRYLRTDACKTAITKAELLAGIGRMPRGRRRDSLAAIVKEMLCDVFAEKVFGFDSVATEHYATILNIRRKAGRPIEPLDAQIAAIATFLGASIATRNVADFENCGLSIINPWTARKD